MDGLVAVRNNAAGLFSPTSEQRAAVAAKLSQTTGPKLTAAEAAGAPSVMVQAAAEAAQSPGTKSASLTGAFGGELGKDSFLQMLVLQLQNQDPLSPVSNEDMLAQLAQFSALEQMENLNSQFEMLSGNIDQLNFISASQLVGKTVRGLDLDGTIREGVVESVHLNGSVVILNVDGYLMSMAGIADILDTPADGGGDGEPDPDIVVETQD